MKNSDWLSMAGGIMKSKVFNKRTPIVVSWALTNRCNSKCKYCSRWKQETGELNTKQIFAIIDELSEMGTRRIIYTGGEPLIREDIGEIIDYTVERGVNVIVNSNGSFIPLRIKKILKLKSLIFSFDGPKDIHDWIRGESSHLEVLEAIRITKDYGIEVGLTTVISKANLNAIDYILEVAEKFNVKVSFQPVSEHLLDRDNSKVMVALELSYRKIIQNIIIKKRNGNKYIKNSITGLNHLLNWPKSKSIKCSGGLISCRIDSEGYVSYCDRPQNKKILNCSEVGFKRAFGNLLPISCDQCWCAMRVELNYLLELNLNCIYNLIGTEKLF